jgi:hypothetical protein
MYDELELQIAKLNKELNDNYFYYAPKNGDINFLINNSEYSFVSAGTQMFEIVKNNISESDIELYVNSNVISKIYKGTEVKIKTEKKYSGIVTDISLKPKYIDDYGNSYYLIKAHISNSDDSLKIGMNCNVSIVTGKNTVIKSLLKF